MARADALRTNSADFEDAADLIDALADESTSGWLALTETFTYASATTITVSSDATTRFQVGDKIKLTNSTVKYFYVKTVTATLLTVYAGTAYSLAAAAITNIYVSRAERPLLFPASFNYTGSPVGFSADPASAVYNFTVENGHCIVSVYQGNAGTSNSTSFSIAAPFTAATVAGMVWGVPTFYAADNSAILTAPGGAQISSAASSIVMTKTVGAAAASWTGSNGKAIGFAGLRYPIAGI